LIKGYVLPLPPDKPYANPKSFQPKETLPMKIMLKPAITLLAATMLQAPARLPIKMGLWESSGAFKVKHPDGSEKTVNRVMRNCATPESWLKQMGPTAPGACPKVNEVWTKDSYSFDTACTGKPKTASVSVHFDSLESYHGSLDIFTLPDGTPSSMHHEFESHWVSDACGDVSPEHPVLVR